MAGGQDLTGEGRAYNALLPIVASYYGQSAYVSGNMVVAMLDHMADRVAQNSWDRRGREHGLMMIAWDWMTGGSTAESFAREAEAALIAAGFEPCPSADD